MIRSFLFALGIFLLVLGAQTLVVDRWIVSTSNGPVNAGVSRYSNGNRPFQTAGYSNYRNNYYNQNQSPAGNLRKRVFQTKEWMPWSLLAAGSIIVLYTYSIGSRSGSE